MKCPNCARLSISCVSKEFILSTAREESLWFTGLICVEMLDFLGDASESNFTD